MGAVAGLASEREVLRVAVHVGSVVLKYYSAYALRLEERAAFKHGLLQQLLAARNADLLFVPLQPHRGTT